MNYNTSKQANALGGLRASQTPYHCPECQSIGFGQRFIQGHLTQGCKGPGRKTLKMQDEYRQYLEEARFNTQLWYRRQQQLQAQKAYRQAMERIKSDIRTIKSIQNGEIKNF